MTRLDGRTAIVTGAAQGVGRATARRLARDGATVVLADRSAELCDAARREIEERGGRAVAVGVDLETYEGADEMVRETLDRFGAIHISVHNVGGTIWAKPYEHYEEKQIEAEIRRSLFPTLWSCRAVLPHMVSRKRGVIVNVSSIATRGVNRAPYAAAKGGVNALTASLAMEQTKNGIRINATAPGGTEAPPRKVARGGEPQTEQEKSWYEAIVDQTKGSSLMHRYGTIEEQVAPILFMASDESSYITGTVLPVGGGDLG